MKKSSKKYYNRPKLVTVIIDSSVSLTPPSDPSSAAPVGRDRPEFGPSSAFPSSPSATNNPFGTSRPDYGDM